MPVVCLWAVEKAARQRSDDESSTLATLRAALDMALNVRIACAEEACLRRSYQIEGQDPCTAPWKRQSGRGEEEEKKTGERERERETSFHRLIRIRARATHDIPTFRRCDVATFRHPAPGIRARLHHDLGPLRL